MSPDRQARMGENEAIMRDVNETVASVAGTSSTVAEQVVFLCECADDDCGDSILLTREAYERVRAVPEHFFVAPGHVRLEVDRVIEEHSYHWVVEKFGEAAEIAEETDPRS